ncbi:hypothetical protein DAI22_07g126800 [Oryza sativa Japonica Group]|nr:hypothetical protein DAI22_07g126800 [Oryza sativa Japonica Group]
MAGKMKQQLGGEMEIDQLRVRDDLEEEEEDEMSWMARKLFLYNVTIGLYGLDWWERYLFNGIVLALLSFIFYGATRSLWLAF